MEDKQFRYKAFKNNTFDLKAVEKSLEESKMSSYQYLRNFQLESTGYRRFDFKIQDIYRTNKINHKWSFVPRRWLFYIEYDFIDLGKRIAYKRSPYYEKDLSYDDIIQHNEIFTSSFLVFVDGKLYTDAVKILCKEDKTYVIFICKEKPSDTGFPIEDMLDYLERNVNVSILIVPNVGLTTINTNGYRVKTNNNYQGLSYRILKLSEKAVYDDNTLVFLKYKDVLGSKPTTAKFKSTGLFIDEDDVQDSIDRNPADTTLGIQIIPLRHLMDKINLPIGEKWFTLPIKDYPIALENCLVFDSEGSFIHEAAVKHYYPNVYSIEGVDEIIDSKELSIYVFYYENTQSVLKHYNMLDSYQKYVTNYLDKYKNGTIPDIVKNFEPEYIDYTINNYHSHSEFDDHFKYKINKMWDFIKNDPNNFKRYLNNLGLRNNYYYVDMSKIDLESKKRIDNSDTGLPFREFKEEMYMFVFRNDFRGMYDKLLVYLDGTRYESLYFFGNDKYDFVYIPCSLVKEDSILEIEKLTEVLKEFEFVASADVIEIDIGEFAVRNKTLFNDLFLTNKETGEYIDNSKYEIITTIDSVEVDISKSDVFLPCTKIVKIKIIDSSLYSKRVILQIKKNFRIANMQVQKEPDLLEPIRFKAEIKNDRRYLRVYRNGRLVPRHLGTCKFPKDFLEGEMLVFPGVIRDIDDRITVELMPYMMNQVCYLEHIPKDSVIDLTGMIDKPFDFKWYDIYVNGRKLAKKEVEIISSNKIKLIKTDSLRWLEIIENSRDKEYFGYKPINDIIDEIFESDEEFKNIINNSIDSENMQDIEQPVVDIPVSIEDYILKLFYTNYIIPSYGLINPDVNQISYEVIDYYNEIMDGGPFLLNPDYGCINTQLILPINPDMVK